MWQSLGIWADKSHFATKSAEFISIRYEYDGPPFFLRDEIPFRRSSIPSPHSRAVPFPLSLSFTDFLCPCSVAVAPAAGRIAFDDGRGQTSSSR